MKAMIFAAGLGTRLRPLTNDKPKALVEVKGMALLEIAIRRLKYFGCREIIINIHHFGEQILEFLEHKGDFGIRLAISDERNLLLETGGGLKKAAWFFEGQAFLLCNADVITNLDLANFFDVHQRSGGIATLAVRNRPSSRYLLFDNKGILSGWRNVKTGERRLCREAKELNDLAFSGIHALSPEIFDHLPGKAVFSIIDVYLEAGKTRDISSFVHDENFWLDVGKLEELKKAAALLERLPLGLQR